MRYLNANTIIVISSRKSMRYLKKVISSKYLTVTIGKVRTYLSVNLMIISLNVILIKDRENMNKVVSRIWKQHSVWKRHLALFCL